MSWDWQAAQRLAIAQGAIAGGPAGLCFGIFFAIVG
jgi:hypothetical protein